MDQLIRACLAVLLVLAVPACTAPEPRTAVPSAVIPLHDGSVVQADTGRVVVPGGLIYWEAAGDGAPVVLIHGGNLDRRMWDAQFAALQRDYRVIRYDARGFGRSSAADTAFRAPDDLAALLQALGIDKAAIVGLSMGGGIAIDFALAYPQMVDRVLLAAPSVTGGTWAADTDTAWLVDGRAAFARGDSVGLSVAWLQSDYIRSALRPPETAAWLRAMLIDNAPHLMQRARDQDIEREVSPPAANRLEQLRAPMLLVVGDADTPFILDIARAIETRAPNVRRVSLPGVGHMVNVEAEAEFNRELLAFLKRSF